MGLIEDKVDRPPMSKQLSFKYNLWSWNAETSQLLSHAVWKTGAIKLESTRQWEVKLERNENPPELKLLVMPRKSKKASCSSFTLSLPHVNVCEGITFSNSNVKVCAGEESDTGIEVFLGMLVFSDPVVFGKPRRRTTWLNKGVRLGISVTTNTITHKGLEKKLYLENLITLKFFDLHLLWYLFAF
jgi:hypothetical protein